MTTNSSPQRGRRTVLSPTTKYEIFLRLMRGEVTLNQAAVDARVDRSTIVRIRQTAKDGALAALAASRPGKSKKSIRDVELEAANAEVDRLTQTVKELAVKVMLLEKKGGWD